MENNNSLEDAHSIANAIVYEVELDSYKEHTINLAIPFASLVDRGLLSSLSGSVKTYMIEYER